MHQNFSIIDDIDFLSIHTKDVLKNHCGAVCNAELFAELESICREHVNKKVEAYLQRLQEAKRRGILAETLINRIQHYYNYAMHKQSPKMRFTKKEYEEALSRLCEEEQNKVTDWLNNNGGYDKYIFQQWSNE